ncbi:hypothetical protein [Actinoplanes solisilvae]|uniref:hypothetical protein n=1 Tax=Actinoplanes solisilvae TaxID=2486853 RepID=UPI000FD9D1DA|nr:hypothetical protein [Actinoplanes solisilvae]
MSNTDQKFTLTVAKAILMPEEAALREFVRQLNSALKDDAELRARFEHDPRVVLGERGVALDFQRELLAASGLSGEEVGPCAETCVVFSIFHCEATGGSATIIIHADEEPVV